MSTRSRRALLAALLFMARRVSAEFCEAPPLTTELVTSIARRTELMAEVAAQKADFALVFDSAQEIATLEAAAATVQATTLPVVPAVILTQLLADCAKHEQEAHIQAAVDAAEAAGD